MLSRRLLSLAPLVLALVLARPASAQSTSDGSIRTGRAPRATCSYRDCALGIVPTWNGLAVVRGAAGPRVANLHFFWPRDITAALGAGDDHVAGADSAAAFAGRAVRLRRVGAALTGGGLALATVAALGALRAGRLRGSDGALAGAGGAALVLGVPFQFAADGALSQAVWWHNLRFAP